MITYRICPLWLASCLLACESEPSPPPIPTEASSSTASGASVLPPPTATALDTLRQITVEDHEEDALVDINESTLESELDRLEAEIGD